MRCLHSRMLPPRSESKRDGWRSWLLVLAAPVRESTMHSQWGSGCRLLADSARSHYRGRLAEKAAWDFAKQHPEMRITTSELSIP